MIHVELTIGAENKLPIIAENWKESLKRRLVERHLLTPFCCFSEFLCFIKLKRRVYIEERDIQWYSSLPHESHEENLYTFQGIPYAKPPLGDLRFKNPVEHDPWDGVKKTIDDHPGCAALLLYYPMGEEDCLYLNVYTSVIDFKNITKLRPVMFWIFGGGFQAGFSDRWAYGPDFFLEDDVVFVSLNYRLGAFGFLALGLPDAQGNQGLKDMQLALEWVQKNIAYFGGDPNQVTLFGESAGATAVGYHMLSPKSEGLFHKAIFQSGTFLAPWAYQSPAEARRLAFELGARMQIQASNEEELLHALKNADVRDIITATSTMITFFFPFGIVMPFIGTIETHQMNTTFLNESPIKKLQSGNYKRVPVLMGYNKDEGVVYASGTSKISLLHLMSIVWKVLTNQIYMITDPGLRNLGDLFINKINPIVNATIWEKIKALSLQDFNWPIDITQRYFAHHNGDIPVYYYHMSHDTKYNLHRLVEPDMNGTSHGDDLSLMFHFAVISPTNPDLLYNRFRKKVVNMWTNFAKYGSCRASELRLLDPTPDEKTIGIRWLPSGKKGLQLDIGYNTFRMGNRVITKQAELFEKMYHKQLLSRRKYDKYYFKAMNRNSSKFLVYVTNLALSEGACSCYELLNINQRFLLCLAIQQLSIKIRKIQFSEIKCGNKNGHIYRHIAFILLICNNLIFIIFMIVMKSYICENFEFSWFVLTSLFLNCTIVIQLRRSNVLVNFCYRTRVCFNFASKHNSTYNLFSKHLKLLFVSPLLMLMYIPILIVTTFLSTAQCQRFTSVVETHKGYVQGRIFETIWHSQSFSAFQGIPYAKPPVGDLRFKVSMKFQTELDHGNDSSETISSHDRILLHFRHTYRDSQNDLNYCFLEPLFLSEKILSMPFPLFDPIESDPWHGVKKTIEDGPSCATFFLYYPSGEEDCLNLNVYTPETHFENIKKLRPVMFWIFGGGFQGGFAARWFYSPDFFMEEDVLLVTVNYRLGALGFLALGLPDAQGNQGLKDMRLALEWVQKNIAYFGGDPNKVTIFGESSGAASVSFHLLSPRTEGLFQQVILQSGTALSTWSYQTSAEARRLAFNLGERMKIEASNVQELLRALKNADLRDITTASSTMLNAVLPMPLFAPFVVTTETLRTNTSFISECPITTLKTSKFKRMPVLMGFTKDEALVFALALDIARQLAAKQTYRLTDPLLRKFGDVVESQLDRIANATIWEIIKKASFDYFSGPIDITQRYLVQHNDDIPVYYYYLRYDTKYNLHRIFNPNINGTSHGDDINLLFHLPINSPTNPEVPYNQFRKKIVRMWANFAKYGDPTPNEETIGIRWLPSGKEGLQLEIDYNTFIMRDRVIREKDEQDASVMNNLISNLVDTIPKK
ncbi:uncharacterized protein LOC143188333 [Calliopsis andreniformis]|uniref:uncharacterized protein LOC143188333 n=1 Tax=Calliopsis andreniformis TaxID=337506 RepID=UPI003FCE0275